MSERLIAVTMGDPGGIGPEVAVRALKKRVRSGRIAYLFLGSRAVLETLATRTGLGLSMRDLDPGQENLIKAPGLYFSDVSREAAAVLKGVGRPLKPFSVGRVTLSNAALASAALRRAASLARSGMVDAIVTAPVNKTAMRLVDRTFVGHTEYLARESGTSRFAMMFVGSRLVVTLATVHVRLSAVSRNLSTVGILDKIQLTHDFLCTRMKKRKPRLGVCCLNPHGAETGPEDEKIIRPAVRRACARGIRAEGPFSADRLFHEAYAGRYDALVSMYHDQALAPFKMVNFHDGVNVTLGLPFIRTSPDHGTAFDLAFRGIADASSMVQAIRLAANWLDGRTRRR